MESKETTPKKKKSTEPNYLLIILACAVVFFLLWRAVNGTGKKKEPSYELYAQTYSQMFIKENYYSDADFPTQKYDIVSQGRRYDVKGKFSHNGEVYTFECIGEYPKASTDEYHIEYLALNNKIVFDIVGK